MSTKIFNSFKYYCDNFDQFLEYIDNHSHSFIQQGIVDNYFHCQLQAERSFNQSLLLQQLTSLGLVDKDYGNILDEKSDFYINPKLNLYSLINELKRKKTQSLEFIFIPHKFQDEFGTYYLSCVKNNSEQYLKTFSYIYSSIDQSTDSFNFEKNKLYDYYFFNNTDQPEHISDEEWKKREKDWDVVFKDTSIKSLIGLNKIMISSEHHDHYYFKFSHDKNEIFKELLKQKELMKFELYESFIPKMAFEFFFDGYYSFTLEKFKPSDVMKTLDLIEEDKLPSIHKERYLEILNFCQNNIIKFNTIDEINMSFEDLSKKLKIESTYSTLKDDLNLSDSKDLTNKRKI